MTKLLWTQHMKFKMSPGIPGSHPTTDATFINGTFQIVPYIEPTAIG